MVNPATPEPCCAETVCCQNSSGACAAFWLNSGAVACSSLSIALGYVEVAVSTTSDRRLEEPFREKACQDCVTDHDKYSRLGCERAPK